MTRLVQDVRFGLRFLLKHPGFTAVTVVTLALGIGANTALFSVINAVLLRPLPYADPERLVLLWHVIEAQEWDAAPIPPPDIVDFRTRLPALSAVAATDRTFEVNLTGDGPAETVRLATVSANFFEVLGAKAYLGRTFVGADGWEDETTFPPRDDMKRPGGGEGEGGARPVPPVVLGWSLWERRFGGDPGAIGSEIVLNGQPSRIVGVLPADFRLLMPADAGMPTSIDLFTVDRYPYALQARSSPNANRRVIARLADGATLNDAREQAMALSAWQRERYDYHRDGRISVAVRPMHEEIVGHVRPVLLALFVAVLFVLLIACANTANLLLVQAGAREREVAIRAAVGGGRRRIVRQFLTEAGLLAGIGGLAGLLLARWAIDLLLALRPAGLPRLDHVPIAAPVLLFTLAATVVAACAFGVVPALQASRPDLNRCLTGRGTSVFGPGERRLRHGIVIAEVALAMVLLVGAGLMFRSLRAMETVDLGFEPRGVLTFRVTLPPARFRSPAERSELLAKLEERIESLPGVRRAGATQVLPMGGQFWTSPYRVTDRGSGGELVGEADYRWVTPGLFDAIGARLLAGRRFTPEDEAKARRVVIVDRAMAARAWPGEEPIGRAVEAETFGGTPGAWKVVGVVETIHSEGPAMEPRETLYFPYRSQNAFESVTMVVRGSGRAESLAPPIREAVVALDPDLPLAGVRTLESYVRDATAAQRFAVSLIGIFAIVALLLAGVGLYGVVSSIARQRTREIGLMMAFGARPPHILARVVRRGLALAAAGLAIGAVSALVLTRVAAGLFPGVPSTDPLTYVATGLLLAGVTAAASLVPAHRATRIDPMVALRYE
ncbi:MAG: ABC transporter permease [Gemmatimonadota bacterium]